MSLILEIQEYAERKYGVDVADQAIRKEPEPDETVLVTMQDSTGDILLICCKKGLIENE
jgi:hypothetical protein